MKSNREIRKETRALLLSGWFGRMFVAFAPLYALLFLVSGIMGFMFKDMEVQTWGDFIAAKANLAVQGLQYSVPSVSAAVKMSGATLFNQFISYLFAAIGAFGLAAVALKAARNDAGGWFKSAFGGFARPFGLMWLLVRMNIQVFLWSLLLGVPGIVAAYRYRLAWFLKCDNPDWSAGRCLAASGSKMRGFKWQAFRLDFSYLWLVLVFCVVVAWLAQSEGLAQGASGGGIAGIVAMAGTMVVLAVAVFVFIRMTFGLLAARAVFYRALEEDAG